MSEGKFSNPRPHRDEERQIEEAFRQVTGQTPAPRQIDPVLSDEQTQIQQTIQEVKDRPISKAPSHTPIKSKKNEFDLLPEDVDAFFDGHSPVPDEPPLESEPDFVDKAMAFFQKVVTYCEKNQKVVMAGACAGALLLILGCIGLFFAGASSTDPNDGKILNNVYLADVHVGGMSKSEAMNAVKQTLESRYINENMVIDLSGMELLLTHKDTDSKLDVKAAVNAAYDYGRTGTKAEQEQALKDSRKEPHIIGLLPYLELDTKFIQETLTAYAQDTGSTLTQTSYGLEGPEPELSADKFNENIPTQTLVITMGTPGIGFDVKDVYNQVLDAYSLNVFLVTVENVESVKEPDPIDLEAIYEEYYIEPVNATVNMQTFETEPGSYGYGFDLAQAEILVSRAEYGEEIRIPMQYIAPDLLDHDSFFRDTLGEWQTRTTGNDNRNQNLQLACDAINGTVLDPGESFSFSSALGNISGFREAPEDTGKEDTDQGGVSQVASTLYYAAMLSDLTIESRSNHGYIPSFIEHGMDATASLKIRNSTGFPIRIEAKLSGGYVKVEIIGTEERDYYIVMDYTIANTYKPVIEYKEFEHDNKEGYKDGDVIEEGITGYLVKTYKIKYDTESGRELSKEFVTNSQYPSTNTLVARVKPEPTTAPSTEPATEPTPSESTPPVSSEAPTTQPTAPPTVPPTVPATEPVVPETAAPTNPATEPAVLTTEAVENVLTETLPAA